MLERQIDGYTTTKRMLQNDRLISLCGLIDPLKWSD